MYKNQEIHFKDFIGEGEDGFELGESSTSFSFKFVAPIVLSFCCGRMLKLLF